MKQSNFFTLRRIINFAFVVTAILLPTITIKLLEDEYNLDFLERAQIWLILLGVITLLQTIVMRYVHSIQVFPDFVPPPQNKEKRND